MKPRGRADCYNHAANALLARDKPKVLRRLLTEARNRVEDARSAGWPALAQSWQRDVDAIKAVIDGVQ